MKISHRNVAYSDIPRLVKEGVVKVGTRVRACLDQEKYRNNCEKLVNLKVGEITKIEDDRFWINTCFHPFYHIAYLDILDDEDGEELIECPDDCGGCSCHINPPCSHCTDGHGTQKEAEEEVKYSVVQYFDSIFEKVIAKGLTKVEADQKVADYYKKEHAYESWRVEEDKPSYQVGVDMGSKEGDRTVGVIVEPKPLSFSEPLTKEAVGKRVKKHEGGFDEIVNISIDGEWMYLVIGFCREKWVLRSFAVRKGWQFDSDKITIEEAEKLTGKKIKEETTIVQKGDGGMYTADFCSMCEGQLFKHWDFCPECGRKIKR